MKIFLDNLLQQYTGINEFNYNSLTDCAMHCKIQTCTDLQDSDIWRMFLITFTQQNYYEEPLIAYYWIEDAPALD